MQTTRYVNKKLVTINHKVKIVQFAAWLNGICM